MNPLFANLQAYPFERLNALLAGAESNPALPMIPLSLGEPKHAAAEFLLDQYANRESLTAALGTYPVTKGVPELRSAIAGFVSRRFGLQGVNPDTEVLPVNGTREALFAFAQVVLDPGKRSVTLMPNPFYQIYEGAAVLGGSTPYYVPCNESNRFSPDFSAIDEALWSQVSLVYLCTPGNPTGRVMSIEELTQLIELSDRHDFVIASDECYSEIWFDEPPVSILSACAAMGRHDFANCVAFNSLSKRSSLPGLRSGYVAGDARLIESFLLYRTYHGSAMPAHNQQLSASAWGDETHVEANRALYRQKFEAVLPTLNNHFEVDWPDAGFYLWPRVDHVMRSAQPDEDFTLALFREQAVKVVPGSYLSRTGPDGTNPGYGRVRLALVAPVEECVAAAQRIATFAEAHL